MRKFALGKACAIGVLFYMVAYPLIAKSPAASEVTYHLQEVEGVHIFYREAGSPDAPTLLLLHGFPSSSFYFRNLIPLLAGKYHIIAPDYPGFGHSDTPEVDKFVYTFDHLGEIMEKFLTARGITHCVIYMQDYGGPVGMRLAVRHPEWIEGLVFQNANVYQEGAEGLQTLQRCLGSARLHECLSSHRES